MPSQLVELAAVWERRWSLGRRRPGCSPAGVLGKGLAEGPARVSLRPRGRPRQGLCRGSGGLPRQGSCRGSLSSNPHLILNIPCLHKDLHATTGVPPEPWPNVVDGVGGRGLKGVLLRWCLGVLPRQGSCRGKLLRPSASLRPWSWRCSGCLGLWFYLGSPPLLCLVWPWARLRLSVHR